jgi:hypothetical protein
MNGQDFASLLERAIRARDKEAEVSRSKPEQSVQRTLMANKYPASLTLKVPLVGTQIEAVRRGTNLC